MDRRNIKWSVFVAFLFPLFSFGQKEGQELIDSLLQILPRAKQDTAAVKTLNTLSFEYEHIDPLLGMRYGKQAAALARKLHWNIGLADAYRNIGINCVSAGDYKQALAYYSMAGRVTPDAIMQSKIARSTGLVYTYQNDYKNALFYDLKALKMSEALNDQRGIAAVLSNIGIVYFDLQDYPKAIKFYQRARKINLQMGNKAFLSNNLGNLGNCYGSLKQFATALDYYRQAIAINEELGDVGNKLINLNAIGKIYSDRNDFERAKTYITKALELSRQLDDPSNGAHSQSLLADIYIEQARRTANSAKKQTSLSAARELLQQALLVEKEMRNLKELSDNYQQLATIESMSQNFEAALSYYRTATAYKDSVFNQDNRETIKNLEDKRSIELRDKQIQLNKATLKNNEKEQYLYLVGIAFLLILALLIFIQSRNRQKSNEKLQRLNSELDIANKVKARFFSILNHDLRSPVANLINFLHLQKDSPELMDEEGKNRMEAKTISSAENLLDSMEDILLWSKGQMENFEPHPQNLSVDSLFEDLSRHFYNVSNVSIQYENPQNLSVFSDENYLKTILRNLTGNAIKALEKTPDATIILKAFESNGHAGIAVQDNGPGGTTDKFKALYDEKEVVGIKSGLGLHLIRDLAKAIGVVIEVKSEPGAGTTFILNLP